MIVSQQARVAARFPATPTGELKLLPTDRRIPDGRHAITAFSLGLAHREWVDRLPALTTSEGTPFDRRRVTLYAYRHSYAQRHADAGVPIDVLRELMDHRKLDTTTGYYRVGETRRRQAVERVATLVFDRRGNRVWRQAKSLLDSEHARPALGEVAAPYGVCTEPSNAKPEAVPAPTGSAASAVTISALTSLTCPTCTPTSTTCCETGSVSSLPPTSTTGC